MLINIEKEKNSKGFLKSKNKIKGITIEIKLIFLIIIFISFGYIFIFNIMKQIKNIFIKLKYFENILKNKEKISKNNITKEFKESVQEIFDEKMKNKYIENQLHFCKSYDLFLDLKVEKRIQKVNARLKNISFDMYVYKENDFVSGSIRSVGSWEESSTNNIMKCLEYYSNKKQLSKKDITILDIGANIGWYSFYLAKAGYELISFEVSHVNDYILKKNYCLNQEVNITIINKGIGLEEEQCLLSHPPWNEGNAVILCGDNNKISKTGESLTETVEFTKLSNYIPYLSQKNLAFIKLDVEGSEGKVINSGIELITKYHIPFLFVEFNNDYLKMQGTDPKALLEIFINNGYSISTEDFFSKSYSSIESLLKTSSVNLYIVYSKFLQG